MVKTEKRIALKSFLTKIPESKVLKLGAADGSCFIFIGKKDELARNAKSYDGLLSAMWKHREEKSHILYETDRLHPRTIEGYLASRFPRSTEESLDTAPVMSAEDLLKYLNQYFERLSRSFNCWKSIQRKARLLVPLMKRRVTEYYESDPIVDDALIVLVEGYEQGTLWTVKEAEERGHFSFSENTEEDDGEISEE